nr:hypothetical protein [uncultured Brevundimonas sp.]
MNSLRPWPRRPDRDAVIGWIIDGNAAGGPDVDVEALRLKGGGGDRRGDGYAKETGGFHDRPWKLCIMPGKGEPLINAGADPQRNAPQRLSRRGNIATLGWS